MIYSNEVLSQSDVSLLVPSASGGSIKYATSNIPYYDPHKPPSEFLTVYVKNESEYYDSNHIQGRYKEENGCLVFTPFFPFEKGMIYMAKVKKTLVDSSYHYQPFQIGEKPQYDNAEVNVIYPLADELPENLLRFYVYFNTPMKKGESFTHIHLLDAAGNRDTSAFMQFKQELWSADGKRLTILFDPGRIKRGVSTNLELGPALLQRNTYKLVISGNWSDVYGQELDMDFTKEFKVVEAYREPIVAATIDIATPKKHSLGALSLSFYRIMDHALVQSMIRIEREDGQLLEGHWEISKDETKAMFFPTEIWEKGVYQVVMNGNLEDVSGNNLNNLLDQKLNAENELDPEELIRKITIQ